MLFAYGTQLNLGLYAPVWPRALPGLPDGIAKQARALRCAAIVAQLDDVASLGKEAMLRTVGASAGNDPGKRVATTPVAIPLDPQAHGHEHTGP
jgi:hypothetical protein